MRINRLVPIFFLALISALAFGGTFFAAVWPVQAAPAKAAATKKTSSKSASPSLSAISTEFSATLPDPKRPGKLLYELRAVSANGQSDAGGFHGSLNSVWARLYQSGVPSAILTAPHAQGGSVGKSVTITGTGGVVVKSLKEPGTILTANTVVWYAGSNQIVATGHVFYRSGKTGATMSGPRMIADTRVKAVYVTNGGHGTARF
jgi:hypothetical protein